jgi:hypothetical protein
VCVLFLSFKTIKIFTSKMKQDRGLIQKDPICVKSGGWRWGMNEEIDGISLSTCSYVLQLGT